MTVRLAIVLPSLFRPTNAHVLPGLHDLRYKANILHRDVSINNIMYQIRDGEYYFILIDFDMAVHLQDSQRKGGSWTATSKNRTGTLPFMAAELVLDAAFAVKHGKDWIPKPHYLRHDYESLFHVSFWSATGIKRPGDPDPLARELAEAAKDMEIGTLRVLAEHKEALCGKTMVANDIYLSPDVAKKLDGWFWEFSIFLQNAYNARRAKVLQAERPVHYRGGLRAQQYDDETIDGLFTRDTLKAALTPAMPSNLPKDDDSDNESRSSPCPEARTHAEAGPSRAVENPKESTDEQNPKESADVQNSKESADEQGPKEDVKDSGAATKGAKKGSSKFIPDENFNEAAIAYRSRLRSSKK